VSEPIDIRGLKSDIGCSILFLWLLIVGSAFLLGKWIYEVQKRVDALESGRPHVEEPQR